MNENWTIESLTGKKGIFKAMFSKREIGQGMVEYALIILLIAIVVVTLLALLGTQLNSVFSQITSELAITR